MATEFEVHTASDGPRINQSNREFQSCYTKEEIEIIWESNRVLCQSRT